MPIKVTSMPELVSPSIDDLLMIVDTDTGTTKKIKRSNLFVNPPLADGSITSEMLGLSKTGPDANGWIKRDYGNWQQYEYTTAVTSLPISPTSFIDIGNISLPVDIDDSSQLNCWVGRTGGYIGRIITDIDNGNSGSPVTGFGIYVYNNTGSSITWSGKITVFAVTV